MHGAVQAGEPGRAPSHRRRDAPVLLFTKAPWVDILAAVRLGLSGAIGPAVPTVTTGGQQLGLELGGQDLRYAGLGSGQGLLTLTLVTYCITGKNRSTIHRGAG